MKSFLINNSPSCLKQQYIPHLLYPHCTYTSTPLTIAVHHGLPSVSHGARDKRTSTKASSLFPASKMSSRAASAVQPDAGGAEAISLQENLQWLDDFLGKVASEVPWDETPLRSLDPSPTSPESTCGTHSSHGNDAIDPNLEAFSGYSRQSTCTPIPEDDRTHDEITHMLDLREKFVELITANETYSQQLRDGLRHAKDSISEVLKLKVCRWYPS